MTFIFIVIPIILETFHTIKGLIQNTFEVIPLIVFIMYIVSAFLIRDDGIYVFENKIKTIFVFIVFPGIAVILLFNPFKQGTFSDLYENLISKNFSKSTVYIYNESSNENIYSLNTEINGKSKDIQILINKDTVASINLKTGNYILNIETINHETGKKYSVFFNENELYIPKNTDIYLCFGGKNFFRFQPKKEEILKLKTGKYTEDISLPKDAPLSKKIEK